MQSRPVQIRAIRRETINRIQDLRARLFTNNEDNKKRIFDILFPNTKDCDNFLEKVKSTNQKIDLACLTGYVLQIRVVKHLTDIEN